MLNLRLPFFSRPSGSARDFEGPRLPWTDRPDFSRRLEGRLRKGLLSEAQAEHLRHWHKNGFLILRGGAPAALIDRMLEDYETGWQERPVCNLLIQGKMERRGADVLAMDRSAPDRNGFLITRELLTSQVRHEVNNVYNLTPEKNGNFDLVLFLGVLYHLRNPMMALDRIRGVMPEGVTLLVESQGLDGSRLDSRGNRVIPRSLPDAFHQLGLTQFCEPGLLGREDDTNLWMPNLRGLCMMLESARFEVVQSREADSRLLVRARAVNDRRRAFMQKADYSTHVYD